MLYKNASKNIRRLVREYGVSNPRGRRAYYTGGGAYHSGTSEFMDPGSSRRAIVDSLPMPKYRGPDDKKQKNLINQFGGSSSLSAPTPLQETLGRQGSAELHWRVAEALTPFDRMTRKGLKALEDNRDLPNMRGASFRYTRARQKARRDLRRNLENKLAPSVKGQNRV